MRAISTTLLFLVACAAASRGRAALVPVERDGVYVLTVGRIELEVDPRIGGRVTRFALDGRNILSGPEANELNFGSTLWTSPQSDWGWPPPAELDRAPYAASIEGAVLVLRSPVSATLGVQLTKRFRADPARAAISIEYLIENRGPAPRRFAAWEVTRVAAAGLTFFPSGSRSYGSGAFAALRGTRNEAAHTWLALDGAPAPGTEQKLLADAGRGALAHVVDGMVFVKSFADARPEQRAPGEGEIELYLSERYLELEVQGPWVTILPGKSHGFTTRWQLVPLPAGAQARIGDPVLIELVTAMAP